MSNIFTVNSESSNEIKGESPETVSFTPELCQVSLRRTDNLRGIGRRWGEGLER